MIWRSPISPPGVMMLIGHYKPFQNLPSRDITHGNVHPDVWWLGQSTSLHSGLYQLEGCWWWLINITPGGKLHMYVFVFFPGGLNPITRPCRVDGHLPSNHRDTENRPLPLSICEQAMVFPSFGWILQLNSAAEGRKMEHGGFNDPCSHFTVQKESISLWKIIPWYQNCGCGNVQFQCERWLLVFPLLSVAIYFCLSSFFLINVLHLMWLAIRVQLWNVLHKCTRIASHMSTHYMHIDAKRTRGLHNTWAKRVTSTRCGPSLFQLGLI